MEFILKWLAVFGQRATSAIACGGGVAALEDEVGDEAVEEGVGVVAVEAVLEEGAGGEGGLAGEEFEG